MKKVVIIGGGFAGSYCARRLEKKFKVVLIDTKNYFEFTPSILRTIVKPDHIRKIQILHNHYLKKSRIIVGEVKKVNEKEVFVNNEKIEFDYLIIASGSSYKFPFKDQGIILPNRAESLRECYDKLCKSQRILIVGGGIVGIELAGEITENYPEKDIIIIHSKNNLMHRNHKKSIKYIEKYLQKRTKIIFKERFVLEDNKLYFQKEGKKLKADMIFFCTGIKPNYDFLKENFSKYLDQNNSLKTNEYLQLKDQRNIFVAGDISNLKEEKTAQNAERHAELVVCNIKNFENKKELEKYIPKKTPMVISLGSKKGLLELKNFIFFGKIPSLLKDFVEWKSMRKLKR